MISAYTPCFSCLNLKNHFIYLCARKVDIHRANVFGRPTALSNFINIHSMRLLSQKRVFNKLMALSAKRSYVSSYAVGKHIYLFRHFHLGIQKQLTETAMFSVPFSQKGIYLSRL